ncbi:MAG: GspE/PulE family protein [Planctomycetes bacterium]|nr:GspE/PulE family protein [Planctomycetota bacterium]
MEGQATSRRVKLLKRRIYELRAQISYAERVKDVMNRIHAARDLDQIFVELLEEILGLCEAEHLTLYAVDHERRELFSRFLDLDVIQEIRLPLEGSSIAGFAARHRRCVNVRDAYDAEELRRVSPDLAFDRSWDSRTGIHSRQVLAVPIVSGGGLVTGAIQLVNKKGADRFTEQDVTRVREIAKTLGIAFHNQYRLARRKVSKLDGLLAERLIRMEDLERATEEAERAGTAVETVLLEKHGIRKEDLGRSLSAFYLCPFLSLEEAGGIPPELLEGLNLEYLKAQCWAPVRADDGVLEILIDDPHSYSKVQEVRRLFPETKVRFFVGTRKDILDLLDSAAGRGPCREDAVEAAARLAGGLPGSAPPVEGLTSAPAAPESPAEGDGPAVQLVHQIIAGAYRAGASDIHVEPAGDAEPALVRLRVDGVCHEHLRVPAEHRRAVASCLKIMAGLDIAERRRPQDGKLKVQLPEREIELRVATVPTAGQDNEDLVLRILAASEPIPLEGLRMSERNLRELKGLLAKPYGLILCVGPTGSGKTTTLHSALGHLNTPESKIWTAEDPVEITQPGLRQVQVRPKLGLDFAAALRSFLRADPDVIMVGEVRDRETAKMALEASLTGHLVLSTLHTNSAAETVTRLVEMGLDPFHLADALLGVLAQRLARTLCRACTERYRPQRDEYDALARAYGEETFERLGVRWDDSFHLHRGKGCETCRGTGYKGRIALHELLVADREVRGSIRPGVKAEEILRAGVAQGMTTLVQDGVLKVLEG